MWRSAIRLLVIAFFLVGAGQVQAETQSGLPGPVPLPPSISVV